MGGAYLWLPQQQVGPSGSGRVSRQNPLNPARGETQQVGFTAEIPGSGVECESG